MFVKESAFGRAMDDIRAQTTAYKLCFGSPAGEKVLQDLSVFCRAVESCYHDDPRKHAVLEGRREVWLRIQKNLNLTSSQIFQIYNGNHIDIVTGDDNG